MTDSELRALVRDAVQRHLGPRLAAAPASVSRPASVVSHAISPAVHASHAIYLSVVNSDDACVIQPSVACDHCGYVKVTDISYVAAKDVKTVQAVKASTVSAVLTRLGRAIRGMEEPAVEKISEDTREDPFQVLISTLLSAQTRDPVTHAASMRLFRVARTPRTMAAVPTPRIQKLIYPVSFYRVKARHVREASKQIVDRFAGRVPHTMADLLTLPGVGRKTANLVLILSHASRDNICVDTHVHRISNRLGWVSTRTPDQTEQALYRVVPKRYWPTVNLYLVTWGQNVCRPVYPRCPACVLSDMCPKIGVTRVGREQVRSQKSEVRSKAEGKNGAPGL